MDGFSACLGIAAPAEGDTLSSWLALGAVSKLAMASASFPQPTLVGRKLRRLDTKTKADPIVPAAVIAVSPTTSVSCLSPSLLLLSSSSAGSPLHVAPLSGSSPRSALFTGLTAFARWSDMVRVLAVCRGAVPSGVLGWVKHGFAVEAMMGKRMGFLRALTSLPAALSVFASAMSFWRGVVARGAKLAFGLVENHFATWVLRSAARECADVALYHGAILSPFTTADSAFAVMSHALAMTDTPAEFHFLLGAMITLA